jgi:hypothetical protein
MRGFVAKVLAKVLIKFLLIVVALIVVAADADAQSRRNKREPKEVDRPVPAAPIDKRDSVVAAAGPFSGRPYWLALAQCGGAYFKINTYYADSAARARVIKPDPKATADYTKKFTDAIKTATTYFDGAERLLMTDRGIERSDAVLTYDPQSRAAGDKLKTVDAAIAATQVCPALYQACHAAYPKACRDVLPPTS